MVLKKAVEREKKQPAATSNSFLAGQLRFVLHFAKLSILDMGYVPSFSRGYLWIYLRTQSLDNCVTAFVIDEAFLLEKSSFALKDPPSPLHKKYFSFHFC